MKKILILLLVCGPVLWLTQHRVYAVNQESLPVNIENTIPAVTESSTPKSDILDPVISEYVLPYPGILPDHPLYVFKNFRDSILEMLISDPLRKIEFYILQSDKEVSASQFLSMKGKTSYLKHTIEHAVTFKKKALSQAASIKTQGKEVPGFLIERLTRSIQKHAEMLNELAVDADVELKKIIIASSDAIRAMQTDIDALKK